MTSTGLSEYHDPPMEDATRALESQNSSSMSTSNSDDASNTGSVISGYPGWLQDYPESLSMEFHMLRPIWDTHQDLRDPLDKLGRHMLLSHELQGNVIYNIVKMNKRMSREVSKMKLAVKESEVKVWAYQVEIEGTRRKIFGLEAMLNNLREELPNIFHLEVRVDDLKSKLTKIWGAYKRGQIIIQNLEKAKADHLKTVRGLQKELKQEQDLKTDFQDKLSAEVVARHGNVERWLADYKIRKMKAALGAAKTETAQWRKVAVDLMNGLRPNRPLPTIPKDPKVTRRQSF